MVSVFFFQVERNFLGDQRETAVHASLNKQNEQTTNNQQSQQQPKQTKTIHVHNNEQQQQVPMFRDLSVNFCLCPGHFIRFRGVCVCVCVVLWLCPVCWVYVSGEVGFEQRRLFAHENVRNAIQLHEITPKTQQLAHQNPKQCMFVLSVQADSDWDLLLVVRAQTKTENRASSSLRCVCCLMVVVFAWQNKTNAGRHENGHRSETQDINSNKLLGKTNYSALKKYNHSTMTNIHKKQGKATRQTSNSGVFFVEHKDFVFSSLFVHGQMATKLQHPNGLIANQHFAVRGLLCLFGHYCLLFVGCFIFHLPIICRLLLCVLCFCTETVSACPLGPAACVGVIGNIASGPGCSLCLCVLCCAFAFVCLPVRAV